MEINRADKRKNDKIVNSCGLFQLPPFARSVAIALAASTCAVGAWLQPVRAEGSRNLYPSGATGFRGNIEWRTSNYSTLRRRTLLKVYAQAGEYILLGSSAVGVTGINNIGVGDIQVYNPGFVTGSVGNENIPATSNFSCQAQRMLTGNAAQGRITSRNQELAGPDTIPGGAVTNGYVPCFYQAPTTGIYDVVFYGPNGGNSNNEQAPTGQINLTSPANFDVNQRSSVAAWDVTVRNSLTSTTDLTGRLFAYYLALFTGNNNRPVNSTLYSLTTDGYLYKTDLGGIDPNGFIVYGNRGGFLNSDGKTPLYRDLVDGTSDQVSNPQGGVTIARPEFPIFFNLPNSATVAAIDPPDPGIPGAADKTSIPATPIEPVVSNASFSGGIVGNTSLVSQGGNFSYNANVDHAYQIVISRDGVNFDPTNPNNRVLQGLRLAGNNTIPWDGKDNSGINFPASNTPYLTRIEIRAGEYHFPLIDVENTTGGPRYTLLNSPGNTINGSVVPGCPLLSAGCNTAFYDDRGYRTLNGTLVGTAVNAPLTGAPTTSFTPNGFNSSTSNQRQFSLFGDKKGLDLWTYFPSVAATIPVQIVDAVPDLTIVKTHSGNFTVGQQGTYTLTVTNASPSTIVAPTLDTITINDTLPAGLSFVSASGTGWTCTASAQTASGQDVNCTNPGRLLAGESSQLILTVNATAAGSGENRADVSTPGETNTGNNRAIDPTIINAPPDLTIVKTHAGDFTVGQNGTYNITVTNAATAGPTTGTITVIDTLPTGLSFVSGTGNGWTCSASGQTVTCTNPGVLAAGESSAIALTVNATAAGSGENRADVSTPGETNTDNNRATDPTNINASQQPADLAVAKIADNPNPQPGTNVTYTVTVSNLGAGNATGVQILDQLPPELTFVSATPSVGTYNSTTGLWIVGSLNNGASATLQIVATVNTAQPITNTAAIAASDQTDPNPNNNNAPYTIPQQQADLSVNKTVDNPNPAVGQTINYTVTLTNNGPSAATGISITDQLPPGLTFVGATASQGTYNSGTGVWNAGNLANGATATLSIRATVNTATPTTNTAQITAADQTDPNSGNNSNSVTIPQEPADLSVQKTVDNPNPSVGQTINYTVTLSNLGAGNATDVAVTDKLPDGLIFLGATPSQGTYDSTTGIWSVGNVANQASATLTIRARVNAANQITNTAQVTASDQPDPNPNNNSGSLTIPQQGADLSVSKTADNLNPQPGTNVTYTIKLTNSGPATATNVQVSEQLPPGLTFVSAAAEAGTYDSSTSVWTVPSLASGASTTLRIAATVNTGDRVTNTATIIASDQTDPDLTDNQADLTLPSGGADLSLGKTIDNPNARPGQNVTYTLTLSNSGPEKATGVQVTEKLPAGLSFVSAAPSAGTYDSTTGIWTVPSLANGASATLQIAATVTATRVTNTASITAADQPDPDSTPGNSNDSEDDQASVTIPQEEADLSVSKTVDNPNPRVGQTVNYTIIVRNSGPAGATNVQVSDPLPSGLSFVSAAPSVGTFDSATGIWNVGAIASGGSATLTIQATLNATGAVVNTATVTSDQTDTNPDNNRASVAVPQKPNLRLVKRITRVNSTAFTDLANDPADPNDEAGNWPSNYLQGRIDGGSIKPGDEVEYTIYFLSDGGAAAANVTVCDLVPANLAFLPDAFGSAQGIAAFLNGSQLSYTNAGDGDSGQFYPAGTLAPQSCRGDNSNGAVVVNLGTLPSANGSTPANSYGFVRFRARLRE